MKNATDPEILITNKINIRNYFPVLEKKYNKSINDYSILEVQKLFYVEFKTWVPKCLLDNLLNCLPF